jgi:hypothetical protein
MLEGTRSCRSGLDRLQSMHEYVMDTHAQTQGIVVPSADAKNCDKCDLMFRVVDNLLSADGVADGTVKLASGGLRCCRATAVS